MGESTAPLRVLLADDTPELRTLFRYALEMDGRFEVVAEAANGHDAVTAAVEAEPDLILLDLAMPGVDGPEVIPLLLAQRPEIGVVVLSAFPATHMADRVLTLGAKAYLEKGVAVAELANTLARVGKGCRDIGRHLPADTTPGIEHAEPDPPSERMARAGGAMRRARWAGAVLALVQFTLYRPPPGVDVPFPQVTVGLAMFAGLVGLNLLSLRMARSSGRRARTWSMFEFGADMAVVFGIVAAFSFDGTSALWALLVIVGLEGAMRYGLAGAMWSCAASAAFYIGREIWAASRFPDRPFEFESVSYRLGIVFIVAFTTGSLVRNLLQSMAAAREAQLLARERARLLQLVAAAARRVAALDVTPVVEALLDCAIDIGFDVAEVCIVDARAGVWHSAQSRGLPPDYDSGNQPIELGLAGLVYRTAEQVVIDDYASWPHGVEAVRRLGFRQTVGMPIYVGGDMVAVLTAALVGPAKATAPQLECLQLLSSQAAVALRNTRLVENMWHQANHDSLTGLPNQKMLEDRVSQALARTLRRSESVALLYLDIDRFKKINDNLGHDDGNQLLKQVAGRLLDATRDTDTVARLGGDEFVVLAADLEGPDAAAVVAAKVFKLFNTPFSLGGRELYVTVSMGVAIAPDDATTFEELRKQADLAMYQGKRRGRNTVQHYTAGLTMAPGALDLEADLHHALANQELFLVYQPQIDLRTRKIVTVEALVRWRHPRRGVLAPDAFLGIAEEAGLMESIDRWVTGEACLQIARWQEAGATPRVAVNVSGATLRNAESLVELGHIVRRSGVDPHAVEFEVTETVTMEDGAAGAAALEELRTAGMDITIDDFGTGFSMLGRLRQFPIDKLKIDKSFVQEIGVGVGDAPLLRAIVSMASGLGLRVVAEGVETEEQASFISRLGCDLGQGYLYGIPVVATHLDWSGRRSIDTATVAS